jgi:hypothetical protein
MNRQQRMKSGTLEEFVREAARAAEQMLDEHGEITPFWLVDTPGGLETVVTPVGADSAEEAGKAKDLLAQALRDFMREHGATRYVFVAESWACEPVRRTPDLPDDEGTVFVTNVADAPIQVMGRRGNDGHLYVSKVYRREGLFSSWSEAAKASITGVEFITGAEAEELLAAIQADIEWRERGDGSLGTHPRHREIVTFCAEDRTQALVGMRDIVRSEGGKPHLSALEINEDFNPAGRFTGLLQERVVH